ncbi:MAG: twin-arginine translocation pathway signal, partial [Alphaproteobacteria bacterium]|nr:twin-arginine translocation pathway signal [Alphaproteobacteria bacterium]
LMVMAGGALRGGKVMGDWPGLAESQLYDRRDVMPTRDLRALLGWLLHSQFGLPTSTIETSIFPGLDLGDDPRLIR